MVCMRFLNELTLWMKVESVFIGEGKGTGLNWNYLPSNKEMSHLAL